MKLEEVKQWLQDRMDKHAVKHNVRKRRFQRQPSISHLMFKLSLQRLALQTTTMREARGWTRQQLSMRAGIKLQLIRNIECGKEFGVSIHTLHFLAKAFGCAVDIQFKSIVSEVERLNQSATSEELHVPSFDEEIAHSNTALNP